MTEHTGEYRDYKGKKVGMIIDARVSNYEYRAGSSSSLHLEAILEDSKLDTLGFKDLRTKDFHSSDHPQFRSPRARIRREDIIIMYEISEQ